MHNVQGIDVHRVIWFIGNIHIALSLSLSAYIHICRCNYVYMYIYLYIDVHACMHACMHTYIHTHTHTHTLHTCIHTYMHALHYITLPDLTLPYITLHYITYMIWNVCTLVQRDLSMPQTQIYWTLSRGQSGRKVNPKRCSSLRATGLHRSNGRVWRPSRYNPIPLMLKIPQKPRLVGNKHIFGTTWAVF